MNCDLDVCNGKTWDPFYARLKIYLVVQAWKRGFHASLEMVISEMTLIYSFSLQRACAPLLKLSSLQDHTQCLRRIHSPNQR